MEIESARDGSAIDVDTGRGFALAIGRDGCGIDLDRLRAMLAAIDNLIAGGLAMHARGVVREARALVDAASAPPGAVVDLHAERAKRES